MTDFKEFMDRVNRSMGLEPGQTTPAQAFLRMIDPNIDRDFLYEQAMLDFLKRVAERMDHDEEIARCYEQVKTMGKNSA